MLGSLGHDRDFLSCDRACSSLSRQGSLCRDIVLRLQVVARS